MHRQERWSMLLLCLGFLPAVLLPATQKLDKTTSPTRNLMRQRRFFGTIAPRVMERMDGGMDQHPLP
jgi:hypothetical protein